MVVVNLGREGGREGGRGTQNTPRTSTTPQSKNNSSRPYAQETEKKVTLMFKYLLHLNCLYKEELVNLLVLLFLSDPAL